jgi:hypothetical protein
MLLGASPKNGKAHEQHFAQEWVAGFGESG